MPLRYYTGFVRDNNDPEQRARLKLEIPGFTGVGVTHPSWIAARIPGGPAGSGLFFLPPVDSVIVVEADEAGNLRWGGGGFGAVNTLPPILAENYPRRSGFTSPEGAHGLVLDEDGGLRIEIAGGHVVRVAPAGDGGVPAAVEIALAGGGSIRIAGGAVEVNGTAIALGDGTTPPLHPFLLTNIFLAQLAGVLAEVVAIGAAATPAPIPTTLTAQLIADIATSLSAGAPLLSTRIKGS